MAPFVEERAIDLIEIARRRSDPKRLLDLAPEMRLPAAGQQPAHPAPELRRQPAQRRSAYGPHRLRHLLQLLPQARRREMAVVAGEKLVPAVAGQRDRDLLAREAADEVRRD